MSGMKNSVMDVCRVVGRTYGVNGGYIGFVKDGQIVTTKDGYQSSLGIEGNASDNETRYAAQLLSKAQKRTVSEAGDGSTTTALLLLRMLERESCPDFVCEQGREATMDDLINVAETASNGFEYSSDIAAMVYDFKDARLGIVVGDEFDCEHKSGYILQHGLNFNFEPILGLCQIVIEDGIETTAKAEKIIRDNKGVDTLVFTSRTNDAAANMFIRNRDTKVRLVANLSVTELADLRSMEITGVFTSSTEILVNGRVDEKYLKAIGKERSHRLTSGLSIITVPQLPEYDMQRYQDMIEDTYLACKSAMETGVIDGIAAKYKDHSILSILHEYLGDVDTVGTDVVGVIESAYHNAAELYRTLMLTYFV
jgi:hypothetical protein